MLMPVDKKKIKSNFLQPINPIFEATNVEKYPEHFDWRTKNVVTPVKNQGII